MSDKPAWLYNQSAVVPYVLDDGELKIVLITSLKSKKWIVPKGVVEKGMTPQESAAKEAFEEAGVIGIPGVREIGAYQYEKWGGICTVKVYTMEVEELLNEWDESCKRERLVEDIDKAVELIANNDLKIMIKNFFAV